MSKGSLLCYHARQISVYQAKGEGREDGMYGLISLLQQSLGWQSIQPILAKGQANLLVSGLGGAAKSLLAASCSASLTSSLLYLAPNANAAEQVASDLQTLLPQEEVLSFPARENPLYGIAAASSELLAERQRVLYTLASGQRCIVVASWEALLYSLPAPSVWTECILELAYGQVASMEAAMRVLVQGGYERVDMVEHPGQFSRRGGILDVYSPGHEWPVRIEFFGDEIDLIRQFDLTTQRSRDNIERVLILPAQESIWPVQAEAEGLHRLQAAWQQAKRNSPTLAGRLDEFIGADRERLQQGLIFAGRERYLPFFQTETWSLLDYLPADALVVIDEPTKVTEQNKENYQVFLEGYTSLLEAGRLLPQQIAIAFSPEELSARLPQGRSLFLSLFPRRSAAWKIERHVSFLAKGVPSFYGQSEFLRQELNRFLRNDYRVIIMSGDAEQQRHMHEYLQSEGFAALQTLTPDQAPRPGVVTLAPGDLTTGFELPDIRLCVFALGDLLQRLRTSRRPKLSKAEGVRLTNYRDLAVGDYVVHVQHGIGQYLGLQSLRLMGCGRLSAYQICREGSSLCAHGSDRVAAEICGAEGKTPRSIAWWGDGRRSRRGAAVGAGDGQGIAGLYAAREATEGYAFPADDEWQRQMEARFPYQETEDQLAAIAAIKADMESSKPMDRLLCGDVGFGKTEVAVRAAFKAAMAGKQVAILVPTTILAEQHYNTFRERFAGFPLEIALMSRFRSPTENKETIRRLSQGLVDVVIGTHRLLQTDVKFWDLGLLVIDEEQRFGVKHKERLKLLRENVDTLTLTATPIPRTLHMAMVGMRDMSVIETPPEDRFPIQTYVVEYNDEMVRSAIRRELQRSGQVYYVHNRVRSIRYVAQRLAKLIPEARIAYGHGQMGEAQLERLMLDFVAGDYDVLVSTTIIESGLDIPNVNTLIVEDADKFGLAQLYQLRGRVGRSNRVAYAYFTYRPQKALSEVADKRLQAIKEFTELGAGFKVAMRDLEIRGAGNILGPEQHGFMVAVGFDLYCQLLEEAVRELKGQEKPAEFEVELTFPVDAYIPDRYIRDNQQKIEMYKKIRAATDLDDVMDIEDEMMDRYGTLPETVSNLLLAARMRVIARKLQIKQLVLAENRLQMRLAPNAFLTPAHIEWLYRQTEGRLRLQPNKAGVFVWQWPNTTPIRLAREWTQLLTQLLEQELKGDEVVG